MNKLLQIVQKYIFATITSMFGILFIYALIFATPVAGLVFTLNYANGTPITSNRINNFRDAHPLVQPIVDNTQMFCEVLLIVSIIGLVLGGLTMFFRSQLRKRYYKTNFAFIGALTVYSLLVAIGISVFLVIYCSQLSSLDLVGVNEFVVGRQSNTPVTGVGFYQIIGFVIAAIMIVLSVFMIILFVDKIKFEKEWKAKYEEVGGNVNE